MPHWPNGHRLPDKAAANWKWARPTRIPRQTIRSTSSLTDFDTAIFVDADTRIRSLPNVPPLRPGIAVDKELRACIAEHLSRWGSHRLPAFEELAVHLTGSVETLKSARWCSEALFAVTKDGNEAKFFDAWTRAAEF